MTVATNASRYTRKPVTFIIMRHGLTTWHRPHIMIRGNSVEIMRKFNWFRSFMIEISCLFLKYKLHMSTMFEFCPISLFNNISNTEILNQVVIMSTSR